MGEAFSAGRRKPRRIYLCPVSPGTIERSEDLVMQGDHSLGLPMTGRIPIRGAEQFIRKRRAQQIDGAG